MKKLMIQLLCVVLLTVSAKTQAQISKVTIQASGLTCSMCSKAIYKSLKSLDAVDSVAPVIKNSSFEVYFKQGGIADFDALKAKVEDAGFFVAKFYAVLLFSNTAAAKDAHVTVDGKTLHLLNAKGQVLDGEKTIRIVDKGFVSSKEYKKNNVFTGMECYKTGVAGSCCAKDGLAKGTRIFHVLM